jgi:peptidoglycan/xylan/chitin deacetylase (PgdA/CDA1 family)
MFRLDRFLTLYCFSHLPNLIEEKNQATPILMYHSISDAEESVHPYYRINTSPEVFANQMHFLATEGYRTINFGELGDKECDNKRVIITFDDGYEDFYSKAYPILNKHGFVATVFLPTNYVDKESFNGRKCLTWQQVNELCKKGISFGSHTHSHPFLRNLSRDAICDELITSRMILEKRIDKPVKIFSYPYRFPEELRTFVDLLKQALNEAGYTHGVTTRIGRHHNRDHPFFMKRLPVNTCDDLTFFRAKLEGYYDWLHTAQVVKKRLKGLLF